MPRAGLGTQYSGEYFWGTLNTIQRQLSFACSRTSQSNTYGVCVTASKSDFDAAIVGSTVYRVSSPTLEKLAASASIATVLAGDDVKLYFDIHPSFSSGTLMKSFFSVDLYAVRRGLSWMRRLPCYVNEGGDTSFKCSTMLPFEGEYSILGKLQIQGSHEIIPVLFRLIAV